MKELMVKKSFKIQKSVLKGSRDKRVRKTGWVGLRKDTLISLELGLE